MAGAFSSLAVPAYRAWFFSQVLSAAGLVTQTVGAAWLVLKLGGGPIELALLATASLLPALLGGPWAGALADRFDRRRLLIITQSAFIVLALALTLLSASGAAQLWSLLLISALSGTVNAVDAPTRQVYVMDLVGRERLVSAVSLYEIILNASRVLGPAVGGVLLATTGPSACFLANAASYLAPLWALRRYRPDATEVGVDVRPAGKRVSVRDGLRYVARTPVLRACVVMAAASGLLFNSSVLFPVLATEAFGLGGGGYGALLACFGVGALPGALWAARHREPGGRRVCALGVGTGMAMAGVGYAPTAGWAFAGMTVVGFFSIWFIAAANTLLQLRSAAELRGRAMGAWTMALPGLNPVTGIAAALLAEQAGVRLSFATGGVVIAAAALAGLPALSRDAAQRASYPPASVRP